MSRSSATSSPNPLSAGSSGKGSVVVSAAPGAPLGAPLSIASVRPAYSASDMPAKSSSGGGSRPLDGSSSTSGKMPAISKLSAALSPPSSGAASPETASSSAISTSPRPSISAGASGGAEDASSPGPRSRSALRSSESPASGGDTSSMESPRSWRISSSFPTALRSDLNCSMSWRLGMVLPYNFFEYTPYLYMSEGTGESFSGHCD